MISYVISYYFDDILGVILYFQIAFLNSYSFNYATHTNNYIFKRALLRYNQDTKLHIFNIYNLMILDITYIPMKL